MFCVKLDDTPDEGPIATLKRRPTTRKTTQNRSSANRRIPRTKKPAPFKPTARSVAGLRRRLSMSKAEFARAIGVTAATVTNWEKATGAIYPRAKGLAGLIRLNNGKR